MAEETLKKIMGEEDINELFKGMQDSFNRSHSNTNTIIDEQKKEDLKKVSLDGTETPEEVRVKMIGGMGLSTLYKDVFKDLSKTLQGVADKAKKQLQPLAPAPAPAPAAPAAPGAAVDAGAAADAAAAVNEAEAAAKQDERDKGEPRPRMLPDEMDAPGQAAVSAQAAEQKPKEERMVEAPRGREALVQAGASPVAQMFIEVPSEVYELYSDRMKQSLLQAQNEGTPFTIYDGLGISQNASQDQIKRAILQLGQRFDSLDEGTRAGIKSVADRVEQVLTDPALRGIYDKTIAGEVLNDQDKKQLQLAGMAGRLIEDRVAETAAPAAAEKEAKAAAEKEAKAAAEKEAKAAREEADKQVEGVGEFFDKAEKEAQRKEIQQKEIQQKEIQQKEIQQKEIQQKEAQLRKDQLLIADAEKDIGPIQDLLKLDRELGKQIEIQKALGRLPASGGLVNQVGENMKALNVEMLRRESALIGIDKETYDEVRDIIYNYEVSEKTKLKEVALDQVRTFVDKAKELSEAELRVLKGMNEELGTAECAKGINDAKALIERVSRERVGPEQERPQTQRAEERSAQARERIESRAKEGERSIPPRAIPTTGKTSPIFTVPEVLREGSEASQEKIAAWLSQNPVAVLVPIESKKETFVLKEMRHYALGKRGLEDKRGIKGKEKLETFLKEKGGEKSVRADMNIVIDGKLLEAIDEGTMKKLPESSEEGKVTYKETDQENDAGLAQEEVGENKFKFTPGPKFSGVLRVERMDGQGNLLENQADIIEYKGGRLIAVVAAQEGISRVADIRGLMERVRVQSQSRTQGVSVVTRPSTSPAPSPTPTRKATGVEIAGRRR